MSNKIRLLVADVKKIKELKKLWSGHNFLSSYRPMVAMLQEGTSSPSWEVMVDSGLYHHYEITDSVDAPGYDDELWFSKDVGGNMISNIFSAMGYLFPGVYTTTKQKILGNLNGIVTVGGSHGGTTEIHMSNHSAKIPNELMVLFSRTPRKVAKVESADNLTPVSEVTAAVISLEDKELLDAVKTLMHLSGEVINTRKVDYTLVVEQNGYTTVLDTPEKVIGYANEKKEHVEDIRELLNRKKFDLQSDIEKLN